MARDGQGPVPGRIAERDSQARIQVGPHVPVDSSWAARARQLELRLEGPAASQSQSPGMTGRTGSESWGRSHVGEAVDINLVMHSVPGPGGRHYHVDRAAGPLARGYDALSARVSPTPPVGKQIHTMLAKPGGFKFTRRCLRQGIQCAAGRAAGGRKRFSNFKLLHALARRHAASGY